MATTESTGTGNGTKKIFPFTFPYVKTSDVKVSLAVSGSTTFADTTNFNFNNATNIQFTAPSGGATTTQESGGAPKNGVQIKIYRQTGQDDLVATFFAGSAIKADDLNNNLWQNLYVTQEYVNSQTVANTNASTAKADAATAKSDAATAKDATDTVVATKSGSTWTLKGDGVGSNPQGLAYAVTTATNAKTSGDAAKTATDTYVHDGTNLKGDGQGSNPKGVKYAVDTADQAKTDVANAILKDGSVQFTGDVKLKASTDPTHDDHAARKKYVDDKQTAARTMLGDITFKASQTFDATKLTGNIAAARIGAIIDTTKFDASKLITDSESGGHTPNDTTMYTTAGVDKRIDSRVKTLVEEVGGFVAIANQLSFPNTNPDINDDAGTLVSIKALTADLVSNGSGTISISNGTVGNSTVTITGAANSTTYKTGYGIIVQTTSTLNTYTFHRQLAKAEDITTVSGISTEVGTVAGIKTEIETVADSTYKGKIETLAGSTYKSNVESVAGNITHAEDLGSIADALTTGTTSAITTVGSNIDNVNSFFQQYKSASSDPYSGSKDGKLWYDQSATILKYHNGTSWNNISSGGINDVIQDSTPQLGGNLDVNGKTVQGDAVTIESKTGTEDYITCVKDGAVTLFHDAASKLATAATGVTVTGLMSATTIDGAAGANLQLDFGTL